MKYLKVVSLVTLSLLLFAFGKQNSGAIQGNIAPAQGIQQVLIISGPDTIPAPHVNGKFIIKNLPSKTYTVLVKAVPPYLDFSLNEVAVIDSATTDIGQIKLLK
jgi:hypothetical protein